ncbi:hypothetical protein J2Y45_000790 [Dyadobacter sp. BE34]|uniref:Uncharacterized protein n=1 Tax=Dyadobacter fermentans TaxID=94254 RepID=A0ABU1QQU6_9BACT|nr:MULTISPECIES: hypothetical protein [Dyadobacter]MDR6803520.1 hypothetical protein [Dyadobacter fermentans]MDR7041261.1 hypothetical protein [Dyadobacter sp. BE242]MDR7195664.1 hypothetical protein [Dyadobacter sp. BE34]MDR7213791.1 hypothetical protein [Dyadobacter sp. BE31]MDR7261071.1 hypothetical protein [Dyadobacter sp. BE32]
MFRFVFVIFLGLFLMTGYAEAQRRTVSPRKQLIAPKKKAPEPARQAPVAKDTTKTQVPAVPAGDPAVADTTMPSAVSATGDTLTEAANEARLPVEKADSMHAYKITIEDISYLSVCPGTNVTIPFKTEGPFDEDNTFIVHIIDATGKSVPISLPVKKSPAKAVIPSYKVGGEVYRLQIISSIPVIKSQEVPLRLLQAPAAKIDLIDGTQTVRIMPGQEAHLRVNLTGAAPWSFRLSDSTTVLQTLSNPHYITVKPADVKAYRVTGVSNACGSGTTSGEAIVNVNNNPEPKLELKEMEKIAKLCAGVPFQVPFNATGKYKEGNKFVVQIAERNGAFKNISTPDSSGYITTQIPDSYKPGEYRLRVTSTAPYLVSQTTNVSIVSPTVATLQKDSLRLGENESGELTVKFTGGGPWFVLLSDGTYENNIQESPHKVKVKPFYDTNYQISSAGGLCGVGKFSGSAKVTVKAPPASITLDKLPQNMVCAGSTIDIPYKTEGRYNPNNKFTVQMTDKSGRFVTLPTTVTPTAMQVKIAAAAPGDTSKIQKIRIVSSSPAVSSAIEELEVIAPDKAIAEVSGRGTVSAGRSTRIQLRFKNGLPPWSFTLSDGTAINGTFLNPYLISVSPASTTEYTISSLKSGCGTGTGRGSAVVTVEN